MKTMATGSGNVAMKSSNVVMKSSNVADYFADEFCGNLVADATDVKNSCEHDEIPKNV